MTQQSATKRSQSIEEYLEAIYKLTRSGEAGAKRLADELHVSAPSVSQMLNRLREAGLVAHEPGGRIELTPEGDAEGARLVRRHRLSERFLSDYLHLPWDRVHDEACKLEHVLSDEVEQRLAEQLGNPRTCPHGNVISDPSGEVSEEPAVPLSELHLGDASTIARVSDERPELLRYLATLGLLPDTEVIVEGVAPFNGPLLVRVGESHYALGREVAGKIFVRG